MTIVLGRHWLPWDVQMQSYPDTFDAFYFDVGYALLFECAIARGHRLGNHKNAETRRSSNAASSCVRTMCAEQVVPRGVRAHPIANPVPAGR